MLKSMIGRKIEPRRDESEVALSERPSLEKDSGTGVIFRGENTTFPWRNMPCAARITIP